MKTIIKIFVCNPFMVNNYVLRNEKNEALLIDAGYSNNEEWSILHNYIIQEKLDIKACLITHPHIDHIWGINEFYNKYAKDIMMSPEGYQLYQNINDLADQLGMDKIDILDKSKIKFISEGEIKIGDFCIIVLETPGHSDGSLCFYLPEDNIILSGDLLFYESVGRTDFITGDWNKLVDSVKNKLYKLPDDTKIYPGHGDPTTIGHEKKNNPFVSEL